MLLRMDPYIAASIRNYQGEILNLNNKVDDITEALVDQGFEFKGKTVNFEGEKPRWESIVLLNNDIRVLFESFDKRTRNKIRRASSLGKPYTPVAISGKAILLQDSSAALLKAFA